MIPKKDYLAIFIWSVIFSCSKLNTSNGLQGISTWMCLGIKSPFIEFKSEIELLSNNSISLNLTQDSSKIPFQNGVQNLDTFINSIDHSNNNSNIEFNSKQGYFQSDNIPMAKSVEYESTTTKNNLAQTSFTNEINEKQVTIIEEQQQENFSTEERRDRKYIIPLALKTTSNEKEKTSSIFQGSSTNIDDLKKHILMLQNLTINDKSFQSKFVVFPSLQKKDDTKVITSTQPTELYNKFFSAHTRTTLSVKNSRKTTIRPSLTTQFSTLGTQTTIIKPLDIMFSRPKDILRDTSKEFYRTEKITIMPQVLLQNDQTPVSVDDDKNGKNNNNIRNSKPTKGEKLKNSKDLVKRKNLRKNTRNTTKSMARRVMKTSKNNNVQSYASSSILPTSTVAAIRIGELCKEVDPSEKCHLTRDRRDAKYNNRQSLLNGTIVGKKKPVTKSQRLNRDIFSSIQNTFGVTNNTSTQDNNWRYLNESNINLHENIDLNPENCYKVSGLSEGQKKLCLLHTEIMPSISRGARSAIQECKHQFKPRRWDCSTVDDDTVFGPITNIGSPEMAYVYALATAGVTSFIARACRDGQLAQCGCSRASRPNHLHEDWTWGGCGDDLEFGYKFSQMFIDIKEKEKKRGIRGLVSIPQKYLKLQEKLLAGETSSNDTLEHINEQKIVDKTVIKKTFNAEEFLKLQDTIKKKILGINFEDIPISELQEKINKEIMESNIFNSESKRKPDEDKKILGSSLHRAKNSAFAKARSLMNLHNNEVGRRAVLKKARTTCKCHGVSGSCSLITCWQQLTSMREIGDFLREKYDAATQVKLNSRGRLQVKDPRYKLPTALDLVYLEESPDWCRNDKQLQWAGTHGRVCNKTSSGLDGCPILCCGRGYNTKKIVVRDRCNCKFQWCCHVKCDTCVKVIEEYTCK